MIGIQRSSYPPSFIREVPSLIRALEFKFAKVILTVLYDLYWCMAHPPLRKNLSCLARPDDILSELYDQETSTSADLKRHFRRMPNVVFDDDPKTRSFDQNRTYIMVQDVIKFGHSWEQVGAIDWLLGKVNALGRYDGCHDSASVERRYRNLNSLIADLREGRSMWRRRALFNRYRSPDEVAVILSSQGRLIFAGSGTHRLSIAKCLSIDYIPVIIVGVHRSLLGRGEWKNKLIIAEGDYKRDRRI